MAEPERRRRRPTTACIICRRRKMRCNRESPCSNCVRSRRKEACVYEEQPPSPRRENRPSTQAPGMTSTTSHHRTSTASTISPAFFSTNSGVASTSTAPSSAHMSSSTPPHDISYMKNRIKQLEEQLRKVPATAGQAPEVSASTPLSNIETFESQMGGTFHIHHANPNHALRSSVFGTVSGHVPVISRSISHKTRLLGQSHWVNTVAPLAIELVDLAESSFGQEVSQAMSNLLKCKSLARSIKSQRAPPWPCPPTPDLPSKHTSDELVDRYLHTVESVYRIFHVPSFRRDYDSFWEAPPDAAPNTPFLVQLKLVLALGAVSYDNTCSLRTSATRWIYEAQTYLSEPIFKPHLRIQTLQTRILLLLAQELLHVSGDAVWIGAGSLLRIAITMGLHRDPTHLPQMSQFQAEMRRRIWNTVLELTLQTSMMAGGPVLLGAEDFDAEPPGNFDDEALSVDGAAPREDVEATDMSVARALRGTIHVRLRVAKALNDLKADADNYSDTIRLDAEVRSCLKAMRRALQLCISQSSASRYAFAALAADLVLYRTLSSVHAPYFAASLSDSRYAFSRKVLVDTSLKIWCAAHPSSTITGDATGPNTTPSPDNDQRGLLSRFIVCGSGFFRSAAFQAAFVITEELRSQLKEDEGLGLGPVPLRTDLLAVAEEAKEWNIRCIKAGETSAKGYLVMCILCAHIDGLRKALGKEELYQSLARAATEAMETSLAVLEDVACKTGAAGMEREGEIGEISREADTIPNMVEDWDFMMPDAMLVPDNQGTLGWTFGDGSLRGLSFW